MPLIICEIILNLTWSARYFIIDAPTAGQELTFTITTCVNIYYKLTAIEGSI